MTDTTVATPDAGHGAASDCRAKANKLYAGSDAMRDAGETYLPKDAGETQDDYDNRKARTPLFNAVRKTVIDMTGKVFAKPVVIGDDVPTGIKTASENIDFAGQHINVFAVHLFRQSLRDGIGYIFVDMPPKPDSEQTRADEIKAGRRPYFVHITADNLIGLRSDTVNGQEELTQVRFKETVTEADGEFHEKDIEQIRVVSKAEGVVTWQTHRKNADGKWIEDDTGTMNVSRIPLAPIYFNRTGFYRGSPPLEDLADLNISHWQISSDLHNMLHYANFPMFLAAGFDDPVVVKPATVIGTPNQAASFTSVEHSGSCITIASGELDKLERRMEAIGLRLVTEKVASSATEAAIDDDQNTTPLAMMAEALKDGIEMAFAFMAEFMGIGAYGSGVGGSVVVNTEFGVKRSDATDLNVLLAMYNSGALSFETFLSELKRRGVVADDVQHEEELQRIMDQAPDVFASSVVDVMGEGDDDLDEAA